MKHEIKQLEKSEIEIKIEISEDEMQPFVGKAVELLSKDIKIKGFRSGRVPANILEQYIDKNMIRKYANELAIQKFYVDIALEKKLQVVSKPKIVIESEEPLVYKAIVAILPEVKIDGYKDIKIPKKEAEVTEKEVNEVLEDILKRFTQYKELNETLPAKKGHKVEIDFEGFDEEGKTVENTKSKNHPIILGEETMVKGFEENLIGMKKDEKKEFEIKFPSDYFKKDFQNKKLKFKVEIKKIEEPQKTELSEELIEKITGKKMKEDEFKKELKTNILERKKNQMAKDRENQYIEELLKKANMVIPEALIEEEIDFIIEEMKENISSKGVEFEIFLEKNNMKLADLRNKYEKEAEKRVRVRLALVEAIKQEGVSAGEEDIKAELDKIKSFYPEKEYKKIQEDYEKGELKNQITNRLTLRKFFEKVL